MESIEEIEIEETIETAEPETKDLEIPYTETEEEGNKIWIAIAGIIVTVVILVSLVLYFRKTLK